MSLIYCFIASFVLSLIFWAIYAVKKKPEIVDVFWFSSIALQMYIYFFSILKPSTISILVLLIMTFYAGRLISTIALRIRGDTPEKRYKALSQKWKNPLWGFLVNYAFQSVLSFGIATVFFPIFQGPQNFDLQVVGLILVVIAIFGEWLCDEDLKMWKKNKSKGVCQTRLWNYSRHPNIFFEIIIWIGLAIMGSTSLLGLIGWISPITIWVVTVIITVPITEACSLSHRGEEYQKYVKTTSRIIPWIKRNV